MEEATVYRDQGFGQNLERGKNAALLLVDFVRGFVDPKVFGGGSILDAAHNTEPVLAQCRAAGIPVIFTRIVYADDGSDAGVWCEKVPALRGLTETAAESQVVDFLAPEPGELLLRKTQASAFFGTGLAQSLTYRGVDTLFVAGCTTSGCVRASVVDAVSNNFRPILLQECIGDRAAGPHDANMFDMQQKYADVLEVVALPGLLETMCGG